MNARGYPHESVPGFSPEAWLEFPTSLENSGAHSDYLACAAAGIRSPFANIGLMAALAEAKEKTVEFM